MRLDRSDSEREKTILFGYGERDESRNEEKEVRGGGGNQIGKLQGMIDVMSTCRVTQREQTRKGVKGEGDIIEREGGIH